MHLRAKYSLGRCDWQMGCACVHRVRPTPLHSSLSPIVIVRIVPCTLLYACTLHLHRATCTFELALDRSSSAITTRPQHLYDLYGGYFGPFVLCGTAIHKRVPADSHACPLRSKRRDAGGSRLTRVAHTPAKLAVKTRFPAT